MTVIPAWVSTVADAVSLERWALRFEVDRVRDELGLPRAFFPRAFFPDEPRCGIDCSGEPTPIYDQLQREKRGAA